MAEQRKQVLPVRVNYSCDKCGGDVLPTGVCLTSYPAQYPHDCQWCGKRYTFTSLYPRIEHVDAVDVANDLARKTLDLPADCDTLAPPTFEERYAANEQALQKIHEMVWGDGNV
jgi:hypothetical protein